MVFENLLNPSTTDILLILVIFLILIMVVKKIIGIVTNLVIIAVAAVLLPIVANRFLGLNVPTDLDSLLNFMLIGVIAYLAYTAIRFAYFLMKGAAKMGKKAVGGGKKEKIKVVEKEIYVEKHGNAGRNDARSASSPFVMRKEKEKRKDDKKKHRTEKEIFRDYAVVKDTDVEVKKSGDYAEIHEKKKHAEPLNEIKHDKEKKKKKEEDEEDE